MRGALEVRNLSLAYPQGGKALENVSFSLQYGDFALLAGDSGSGKSSLLSCINGVIPQINRGEMQGEILLDGVAAAGVKMGEIARRVGSVLQDPDSQIFHSRVEDEIAFGCENLNMPPEEIRRRVEESCALFQLEREAFTRRLSGGQKQRLLTACVFAMGQKILLLDEPLANLDREAAGRLLGSLKELCRRGYAVLLAEHRLDIALPPADRLLCLEGRRLVEREPGSFAFPSPGNFSPAPNDGESRSGETLLEAAGLSYSVKEREILRDVSLSIRRGERVALLGENGSGKTTLLRLLAGLIKPSGGALRADLPGRPGSRKWFRSVGYVYQNPSYQLFMPTVEEELAQGAAAGWARRCLEDFDLAALATRHPLSLSEGEKRRLSIAAVLAGQPRLLLLDEPTVGQDQRQLERMINALNRIHRETGNAMVTVTHDPRCAEALADRAIQLENGSVFSSDIFSFR